MYPFPDQVEINYATQELCFRHILRLGTVAGEFYGVDISQQYVTARYRLVKSQPVFLEVGIRRQDRKVVELERLSRIRLVVIGARIIGPLVCIEVALFADTVLIPERLITAIQGQQDI